MTKRRPFTDPVIVHVISVEQAKELVVFETPEIEALFESLAARFWPGPLTFILKCNFAKLDRIVTAQSDYVGVRFPKSEIAQELIRRAGVPIAAPSANLFSHVSPTSSIHVFNDFFDQRLSLVDGPSTEFGVESTVIKLSSDEIDILRYGSVSELQIREALSTRHPQVKLNKKHIVMKESQVQMAPGQLLKHYSPNISCYLFEIRDSPENK